MKNTDLLTITLAIKKGIVSARRLGKESGLSHTTILEIARGHRPNPGIQTVSNIKDALTRLLAGDPVRQRELEKHLREAKKC